MGAALNGAKLKGLLPKSRQRTSILSIPLSGTGTRWIRSRSAQTAVISIDQTQEAGEVSPALQPRCAGLPLPPLRGAAPQRPALVLGAPAGCVFKLKIFTAST